MSEFEVREGNPITGPGTVIETRIVVVYGVGPVGIQLHKVDQRIIGLAQYGAELSSAGSSLIASSYACYEASGTTAADVVNELMSHYE